MNKKLLMLIGGFPTITGEKEPNGYYFYELVRNLTEQTGIYIQILAFRKKTESYSEQKGNISIKRIDLPRGNFQFDYNTIKLAIPALAKHGSEMAASMGKRVPVLCHGYEAAQAAVKLKKQSNPVIGALHYLFAQELLNRMEASEDPFRRKDFPPTMAYLAGKVLGRELRPSFVRLLTRNAPVFSKIPLPSSLELLFSLEQEAQYLEASDIVVAVGRSFGASIQRYHPWVKNKLRYSFAGAPSQSQKSYWPFPKRDDCVRLVMVARPVQQKGWDYMAAALKRIESQYPKQASKLEFVAIGGLDESGNAFGNQIYRNLTGLKKVSCRCLGQLSHDEVMEVMSAADAIVLPSLLEAFGLVIVEAMANGCVVLASDTDGSKDILKAPWGQLLNFQDPSRRVDEVEGGILKLLSLSRQEIQRLGQEARETARAYSWKKCALDYAEAIVEAEKLTRANHEN